MPGRETDFGSTTIVGTAEYEFRLRLSPRLTRRSHVLSTEKSGEADAERRRTPAVSSTFMSGENFWAAPNENDATR